MSILGCSYVNHVVPSTVHLTPSYHDHVGLSIEYPEVAECGTEPVIAAKSAIEPHALNDPSQLPSLEMTLQEAVQLAVQKSPVLRTIGGTVVTAPQAASTIYGPALAAANPLSGTEAALSAFDAQLNQQLFWTKTDRPNNVASGGVTAAFTPTALQATGGNYISSLSKRTAQGAQFALRHTVLYNRSNQPFRAFPSDFTGFVEAEWRQPLMRGAGTEFNRIVGSAQQPGQYNGVLIARVNEDVALADFETAMITLVADVEQAYWNLSTAYRILEANLKGRASAQQTWQYQQVRLEVGSGRSDEEAQAQSQFYQFQAQVESSLGGANGLYAAEQQLRSLIGLTATDGRLIKPTSEPTDARVVFDWDSALGQAIHRRIEIRRQKISVKRRELELTAARLNRRPQLDFLGQYRWRGLGDNLIGDLDEGSNDGLYQSITSRDFQEWQAGFELNLPVGLRAASVALSHARLNLQRERSLLAETELQVSHNLTNAARQVKVTHQLLETNYNRHFADLRQAEVLERRYRDGSDNINFLLQAQRQVVTSETAFYQSLANYNIAIRDLHRAKGSLLAYNQVQISEAAWSGSARRDAVHVGRFLTPSAKPGSVTRPAPLTRQPFNPSAVQSTGVGNVGLMTTSEVISDVPVPLGDASMVESDEEMGQAPPLPPAPEAIIDSQ